MAGAALRLWFSGRVQGVGFRYQTKQLAENFEVSGYVQNLSDGRVEVHVEGDKGEVENFVSALQERMRGFIQNTEQRQVVEQHLGQFVIRREA